MKKIITTIRNEEEINLPNMTKPFFDRRVEKRSLSGAKPRLFKEVYRKMAKSDGKFIFFSFLIAISTLTQLSGQCLEERHNTNITDAWVSCQTSSNPNNTSGNSHWILYNFDSVKNLYESIIWNINHPDYLVYGAKRIRIDYSLNKTNWTYWGELNLAQATARSDYIGESGPDFNGLATKHLLITVLESYGNMSCTGFSEIKISTDNSSCPNEIVLDINDDIFGTASYQASSQIIINNTIHNNADVTFQATDRIQFLSGFSIEQGAELKAYIGGCGN